MVVSAQSPDQIISLPQGGGALQGIGEKFTPDMHTGTGNLSLPIAVPPGRRGLAPALELAYSTGAGNGVLGLGWGLNVPGIARKTSRGVPTYDDTADTFLLSGSEDLVVEEPGTTEVRYRPRTEGLFAKIVHHHDLAHGQDYWEVTSRDGLTSRYGTRRPNDAAPTWRDPAALTDPDDAGKVFAWKLSQTRDPLGNVIVYGYEADAGHVGGHRWRQPMLRTIHYADYVTADGTTRYAASVTFDDEEREDAFSSYTAGFEIRTTRRYRSIITAVHTPDEQPVRRYELGYDADPLTGVSLLSNVEVVGFDDVGAEHRDLAPVTFAYSRVDPAARRFQPVTGPDPPPAILSRPDYELVDLTGDGTPDVLQLNGVARYWRNAGGGTFDRPRMMRDAPAGVALADPGVQLLDADGDGCADLLVTTPTTGGYYPLRFGPAWGGLREYVQRPTFSLDDPEVQLTDLDGDGVTDALRAGDGLECFFADPVQGWVGPRRASGPDLPKVSIADPRVRFADMSGDGLQDLVLIHGRNVDYWPNLGHGRFGARLRMASGPQLPLDYDPARVLLGDLDGDGCADLVYADADGVTVWLNRSGNAWSVPETIRGLPIDGWDLRITDLLGTGTGGLLASRDAPAAGRPPMYFLDLAGGVQPRLLTEIDNHIGAVTRIGYRTSTSYAVADNAHPATRWHTTLPFAVPVVATVEVTDQVSGSKLSTAYQYRHGYWDGPEREFRGFGRVEQVDTETSTDARAALGDRFSPPTVTRTWFHLGVLAGDVDELDLSDEYWAGDRPLLDQAGWVRGFLAGLRDAAGRPDRQARRDAVRALRGQVVRSELYAMDGSQLAAVPYTVTEHAYQLREEPSAHQQGRPRVFTALTVRSRTTQWERGTDPMTRFTIRGRHDEFGQPRSETTIAPPRRSSSRRAVVAAPDRSVLPDETTILAVHTRTAFAEPDPGVDIHDRVAQVRRYELRSPPTVHEQRPQDVGAVLADQRDAAEAVAGTFDALDPTQVRLIGHVVHHYDGPAYRGRDAGALGPHGLLTRSESLVLTDAILDAAYQQWRPSYLGGSEQPPAGAPPGFGADLGYRREAAGGVYVDGWYADTTCQAYDLQLSTPDEPLPASGVVVGARDPLGHETRIRFDAFSLFPTRVRDPVGLETTASYNYRAGRPSRVVDPNGHVTNYRFHPLGLLESVYRQGADGRGGTAEKPEISYTYWLRGWPVHVHTTRRVAYASDAISDEVIESREYSDGFGRLVQQRAQADDLAFGDAGDDVGLLVPGADGVPQPLPGRASGPAVGVRVPDRVVVSGWQVYDNKGRVVESYEPFFDAGWEYQPQATAGPGRRTSTRYDPRGLPVRVVNPDGAQRRQVVGVPADLAVPDIFVPTPWAVTGYDENDLAAITTGAGGASLASRTPPSHHFTPTTTLVDGLGRTICLLTRGGPDPAQDWHLTQTHYDLRGNPLTLVDELGRVAYETSYDLLDRALRVDSIDADQHATVLDAGGNVVATRDARGCIQLRTYDVLGRLVAELARDVPTSAVTLRVRVRYGDGGDPAQPAADRAAALAASRLGRVAQRWDEAGQVSVEVYDLAGNAIETVRRVVADAAIAAAEPAGWTADWAAPDADDDLDPTEYRTSTRYDALSRPVQITAPADVHGHRAQLVRTYSRSGALRSVTVDGTPYLRLLAHNARGQRVLAALGNGLVTRYAYDPDSFQLTRLRSEPMTAAADTWTSSGSPLQDLTHHYDLVGNVTAIEERTAGCGIAGTADGRDVLVRAFGYDPLYRLVSATGRACADIGTLRPLREAPRCGSLPLAPTQANAPEVTTGYRESYTYDPVGNLVDLFYQVTTGAAAPSWHRVMGVDAASNRVTGVRNGPVTSSYGFDASGNLLAENGDRRYTWDHAGRLVGFRVQAGGGTSLSARYLYGADGRRVKKWVRRGGTGALDESTTYLGTLYEHQRWTGAGGGQHSLLHVLDGVRRIAAIRSGAPHPDDAGPATRYELTDNLGSVSLTLDDAGSWVNREEYFPYGETSFGGFARKRYRFTGRERDVESGHAYHAARYYAPSIGRWISPDPAGTVDGTNLYRYGQDNPSRSVDLNGTQPGDVSVASSIPQHIRSQAVTGAQAVAAAAGSAASPAAPATGISLSQRTKENLYLLGGLLYGTYQSLVPGGFLLPSPAPENRPFEIGRGGGQTITGLVQLLVGAGIAVAGAGTDAVGAGGAPFTLGGSLVLEIPGTAALAIGLAVGIYGSINTVYGAATLQHAMAMSATGSGGGTGGGPSGPAPGSGGGSGSGSSPAGGGGSKPPLTFTSKGSGTDLVRTTQSNGVTYQFKTGHAFNRPHTGPGGVVKDLRTTGLTPDEIETAIVNDLEAYSAAGGKIPSPATPGFSKPLERTITVGGSQITYRAVELGKVLRGIGTYFLQ